MRSTLRTQTSQKLKAWLNGDQAATEDNGDTPPDPQPTRKPPVAPMPAPMPAPNPQPVQTKRGTTVLDLFNILRELGLANQAEHYEDYLIWKYGHGSRGLSADEITDNS